MMRIETKANGWILCLSMAIAFFEASKGLDFFRFEKDLQFSGELFAYGALSIFILGSLSVYIIGHKFGRYALIGALLIALLVESREALILAYADSSDSIMPYWVHIVFPYLMPAITALALYLLWSERPGNA